MRIPNNLSGSGDASLCSLPYTSTLPSAMACQQVYKESMHRWAQSALGFPLHDPLVFHVRAKS